MEEICKNLIEYESINMGVFFLFIYKMHGFVKPAIPLDECAQSQCLS